MRIIVCGGRKYHDRAAVFRILDRLHAKMGIDFLIQGAADGADYLAWQWADERDVPCGSYAADWDDLDHPEAVIRYRKGKPYNANAGAICNQRMIDKDKPDGVIAFPGGPGTVDMIRRAEAAVFTSGNRSRTSAMADQRPIQRPCAVIVVSTIRSAPTGRASKLKPH